METRFGVVDFEDNTGRFILPNLTVHIDIPKELKDNPRNFINYDIKDGDRIDTICDRAFGSADFILILLAFNDIHQPDQWPVPSRYFDEWYTKEYPDDLTHTESVGYLDSEGRRHDPEAYVDKGVYASVSNCVGALGLRSVLQYDLVKTKNENKRKLKIPLPSLANELFRAIETALEGV